jgi:heme exporter protein D
VKGCGRDGEEQAETNEASAYALAIATVMSMSVSTLVSSRYTVENMSDRNKREKEGQRAEHRMHR